MNVRCINLDWLEVYALESVLAPRNQQYFEALGYTVKPRNYGTPQYAEMFTVMRDNQDFIEIRRAPYSVKSNHGIFEANACHLRLSNRMCYAENPIAELQAFMVAHDYTFKSISRIDIALDFQRFDNDVNPADFVRDYMQGGCFKVNQPNVSAHGVSGQMQNVWNSLKWGAPSSPISTKLYNKSLELSQAHDKPYIRQRWEDAGLVHGVDVWRIEFSCSAQMQSLKAIRTGDTFKKSLLFYATREHLLEQFRIFFKKYFDFRQKEYTVGRSGVMVPRRKYDCTRIEFFRWSAHDLPYKPARNITKSKRPDRTLKILRNRLDAMRKDDTNGRYVQYAAYVLSCYFQEVLIGISSYHEWLLHNHFELTPERVSRLAKDPDAGTGGLILHNGTTLPASLAKALDDISRKYGLAIIDADAPF